MPTRKVSVSAVSGAVVAIALYIFTVVDPSAADKLNTGVAVAASTLIATILAYIIPEPDQQP